MATKKVYLVDTENVGSTWKDLLPAKTGTDQILLFFTENSPYVSYTDLQLILQFPDRFEMIKCNPGKNGLDFQLVSYLGYLLKAASKANYVIVSNDCGFDAVVKFWQERGMSVSRTNVYHVLQPDTAGAQETEAAPAPAEAPKEKSERAAAAKKSGGARGRKPARTRAAASPEETEEAVENASAAAPSPETNDAQDTGAETPAEETGTAADAADTVQEAASRTKKASAPPVPEPSDSSAFPDTENMELDFSNLTVSEKAALLRKYLPKEFSEHQESLDIISDIMFGHDTTNHHQLHLAFVKSFGDEKGTLIYKAFRPHLAEFRA